MNRSNAEILESDQQSKFVQSRITNVEKQFGFLCEGFAGYARKCARVRDKGDELSKALVSYTETETLNHTYKTGITKFAENLSAVQDYRQAEIHRLEARVIGPLMEYGTTCKHARDDLKSAFTAQTKEKRQQKKLETIRDKAPSDRGEITKAERSLHRAGVESARTSKALEEQMDTFERKKLTDIKKILYDFVTVEMSFHAKALEVLTSSYQSLNIMNEDEDLERVLTEFVNVEMIFHAKALEVLTNCYKTLNIMDEHEDLEEFRNSLRPTASSARMNNMKRTGSRTSLNSAGLSTRATPPSTPRRKPPAKPKPKSKPNHYPNHNDDLSDEEEEDDYDDEDDENDTRYYNGYRR